MKDCKRVECMGSNSCIDLCWKKEPKQEQGEPVENRFVRELREYGKTNQGAYLFPSWDIHRALKYLDGYTTPQQPVIDKSAAIRIATALGWTPPKQEQGEQEENRLIQQRDHAHEIIDKLCDAVLGFDRQEWSSAYFFEDAVNDVEEKMWQLDKQEQGEHKESVRLQCVVCNTVYGDGVPPQIVKQEQDEPVAITITGKLGNIYSFTGDYSLKKGDKVYTTPQQRKPLNDISSPSGNLVFGTESPQTRREPLTDEQITALEYATDTLDFPQTVRAIEAAHGIKEQP